MLRFRSNCRVTFDDPRLLFEVISVIPAIRPNMRSRGVATADAITSGLAPGRLAKALIVGYSTCGIGATGRNMKATPPAKASAALSSDVATGRLINGVERLMSPLLCELALVNDVCDLQHSQTRGQTAESQIHTRRRIK